MSIRPILLAVAGLVLAVGPLGVAPLYAQVSIGDLEKAIQKQEARISELEKAVNDSKQEIAKLRGQLKSVAKKSGAGAKASDGRSFVGIAHIKPAESVRSKLKLADGQGAQVVSLFPDSPAEKAGLAEGDVITKVNGKDVGSENIDAAIGAVAAGTKVELALRRGDESLTKSLEVVKRGDYVAAVSEAIELANKKAAVFGITVEEIGGGLVVRRIEEGLTGEVAKVAINDSLIAVNGKSVNSLTEAEKVFTKIYAGDKVSLKIQRGPKLITTNVIAGHDKGEAKLVGAQEGAASAAAPRPRAPGRPAYLGVNVSDEDGKIEVLSVARDSAADASGLREKDVILDVDGKSVKTIDDLSAILGSKSAGDSLSLVVERGSKKISISNMRLGAKGEKVGKTTAAGTAPAAAPAAKQKGYLGLTAEELEDGTVVISKLVEGGPAAGSDLKVDDVILKIKGASVSSIDDMVRALKESFAGDSISIEVRRGGKSMEVKISLGKRSG